MNENIIIQNFPDLKTSLVWHDVRSGYFPCNDRDVLVSTSYGEYGVERKEVCASSFNKEHKSWSDYDFPEDGSIVTAWADFPEAFER